MVITSYYKICFLKDNWVVVILFRISGKYE